MFAKHKNADLLASVILVGDVEQLFVMALSTMTKPQTNEFGQQMQLTSLTRFIWGSFPSTAMTIQYRMHPDLSRFVISRTYEGRMTNAPTTRALTSTPALGIQESWNSSHQSPRDRERLGHPRSPVGLRFS